MKIIWSNTANYTFKKEQDCIFSKWNAIEVLKFVDLVDAAILKLKDFPEIGVELKNHRYLVISKQTTLFYQILDSNNLKLLLFWNNKWNPDDFNLFIKK